MALLTAAFSLLLALLLIRQRRQRNLASVRDRTAVLRTSPAAVATTRRQPGGRDRTQIRHCPGAANLFAAGGHPT